MFSRPIYVILAGSSILSVVVLLCLIAFSWWGLILIDTFPTILITLIVFAVSFGVFALLVGRFVNNRVQHVYRIISSEQVPNEASKSGLSDDMLDKLSSDSARWAISQKKRISQLQKQAEFRKEFLGNLAHELKTPVFSIQGYILTLLEGGLEDERVNRDFLERTLSGVDRISNLLEDLDEISKYENDRFDLKLTKFNIIQLCKSVFGELESKAEQKNITLSFSRHFEPIMVLADKNRITQVLVNLISNSISYGKENGETKLNFISERNQVMIEVIDNGVGMSQEHIDRLFERFYRIEKSRDRNVGGSGLGLAIVKHIVEAHEQKINVRSTENVGSTFFFSLKKA